MTETHTAAANPNHKWYIVHVYSNFEKKVAESIREQAHAQNLDDSFSEIMVPTEDVVEIRRGRKINGERKFFPGYVLVKTDLSDEAYHLVKNTPKVTGFLGSGSKPMPVSEREVARIIGAIEERRGFRPSPGSIYPTLQMLEDGGFVTSTEVDGKRVYTITDSGRALLAGRTTEAADESDDEENAQHRFRTSMMKLAGAAMMGVRGSDDATLDRIRTILDRARKEIYAILATDEA